MFCGPAFRICEDGIILSNQTYDSWLFNGHFISFLNTDSQKMTASSFTKQKLTKEISQCRVAASSVQYKLVKGVPNTQKSKEDVTVAVRRAATEISKELYGMRACRGH